MIRVRKAIIDDSKDIFEWRNDELTRQMSLTTDLVEWEGHCKWFAANLSHANRLLAICELERAETKVGIVRFDVEAEKALISINLSPSMRGKGLAEICLREAMMFFTPLFPNVECINAEIKSANVASKRSFESAGFTLIKERNNVHNYKYTV